MRYYKNSWRNLKITGNNYKPGMSCFFCLFFFVSFYFQFNRENISLNDVKETVLSQGLTNPLPGRPGHPKSRQASLFCLYDARAGKCQKITRTVSSASSYGKTVHVWL